MEDRVYSYHTFILPFILDNNRLDARAVNALIKCFDENTMWINSDISDEFRIAENERIRSKDDEYLFYQEYHYFHPYVRKALYGFGDGIVHLYTLKPDIVKNRAHYYIREGGDEYDLLLSSMQIRIFNSEVGLFIMEGENRGLQRDGKARPGRGRRRHRPRGQGTQGDTYPRTYSRQHRPARRRGKGPHLRRHRSGTRKDIHVRRTAGYGRVYQKP